MAAPGCATTAAKGTGEVPTTQTGGGGGGGGEPTTRNDMIWQHHMLIIFATEERDPRLDEQRRALGPGMSGLQERDIRVVEVVGTDPLRDSLIVPLEGFHVLLVGRDGRVRMRQEGVVPVKEILELVEGRVVQKSEARKPEKVKGR